MYLQGCAPQACVPVPSSGHHSFIGTGDSIDRPSMSLDLPLRLTPIETPQMACTNSQQPNHSVSTIAATLLWGLVMVVGVI